MTDVMTELLFTGDRATIQAYLLAPRPGVAGFAAGSSNGEIVRAFAAALPSGESLTFERGRMTFNGVEFPAGRLPGVLGVLAPEFAVKQVRWTRDTEWRAYYVRRSTWWTDMERYQPGLLAEFFTDVAGSGYTPVATESWPRPSRIRALTVTV